MAGEDVRILRVEEEADDKGKKTGRRFAVLSDCSRILVAKTPASRSPKTGPAADVSANPLMRAAILLDAPASYRQFDRLKYGTDPVLGGRRPDYPRQLWSLLWVLQNAIATQVALLSYLSIPRNLDAAVEMITGLRDTLPPADQEVIDRWLTAGTPMPDRTSVCKMFASLRKRGLDHEEHLRHQGVRIATSLGRLNPTASMGSTDAALIGDGTVLKAASRGTATETIDLETGEITTRRPDALALVHHEGGGTTVAYGTKIAAIWSPSGDRHGTVCMGLSFVDSPSPVYEANTAVNLVRSVQADLAARGHSAGFLAYDRAADGPHQQALNDIGMLLVTRPKADDHDETSKSHYLKPKFIGTFQADCGCAYAMFAIKKRLVVQHLGAGGDAEYRDTTHAVHTVVRNGKRYHYSEHTFTCSRDTTAQHTVSIPWNGWDTFNRPGKNKLDEVEHRQYLKILNYLQPHAPGTADHRQAFGVRERAETMHSIIDDLLPFERLQRWSLGAKQGFIYGYMCGHNIVAETLLSQTSSKAA